MKVLILTDSDLDGSGSALVLKWLYSSRDANIRVIELVGQDYSGIIQGISKEFEFYDMVYITDSYIADDAVQYVDKENVVIIDHHADHINVKDRYKTAKVIMKNYPSCCKLIYDIFKEKLPAGVITPEREQLINLINDYDSYALEYKDTLKLHAIFNSLNRPKVNNLIDRFYDGTREWTIEEKNMISLHFKKIKHEMETRDIFTGKIKDYRVISYVADYGINEVAHFMLKKHNADIVIILMLPSFVSFRRSVGCDAKLNNLASGLCEGGGHEYAAGGKITDQFLQLTKTFKPL
jgi:oligoribonuclease NrnB/cAMP/cGMP phosphodiesterase (DHH superfamily)